MANKPNKMFNLISKEMQSKRKMSWHSPLIKVIKIKMMIHCFGKHMRKMNFYIPLVGQNDSRIFPESNVEILLYTSVHVCMYL